MFQNEIIIDMKLINLSVLARVDPSVGEGRLCQHIFEHNGVSACGSIHEHNNRADIHHYNRLFCVN